MMIMSIYRAQQPVVQWDLPTTYRAAGTKKEDLQLIRLSYDTGKPVLVGIDGQHTIVKPVGDGDEDESFESLYDTCYTVSDLGKMKAAGVDKPEDVPLTAYRVSVGLQVAVMVDVAIALLAKNAGDVRPRFRELMLEDSGFRTEISLEVLKAITSWLLETDEVSYVVHDTTSHEHDPIEPPLDPRGKETWRILSPGDEKADA